MVDRISSADSGYVSGDLSTYPEALDSFNTLYKATNNAETKLKQTLPYNGKVIFVDDNSKFPETGVVRINSKSNENMFELVYYEKKTSNTFQTLKRGFSGTRQNLWVPGDVYVSGVVHADMHNAKKDAILNIEENLGISVAPASTSLNGILKYQETRFLAPKPIFRAFPIKGPPPLTVTFQNFSTGSPLRYLWDFGDGGTSLDDSPTHTYMTEGKFTVKLNMVTSTGAQGIVTKLDYIEVNRDEAVPFFYVESISNPYSAETAAIMTDEGTPTSPKDFLFIDQTDGDIVQRNWIFGDGQRYAENDPDIHTVTHIFNQPGEYPVSLLVIFSNGRLKRVDLAEELVVV